MAKIDDQIKALAFTQPTSLSFDEVFAALQHAAASASGMLTKVTVERLSETECGVFVTRAKLKLAKAYLGWTAGTSGSPNEVEFEVMQYSTAKPVVFGFIPIGPADSAAYKPYRDFTTALRPSLGGAGAPVSAPFAAPAQAQAQVPMAPAPQTAAPQAPAGNPNKTLAWVLVLLGAIPLTIGVIKLYVTGFYPSELPLFGGLALGGIGIMALGRWIYGRAGKPPANTPYLPQGHGGGGAAPHPASPVAPTQAAAPVAALPIESAAAASNAVDPAVDADYHRLQAPDLTAVELQEVAARSPQLRPRIAAHALAYPALLDWLAALGDPAVDAALAARSGQVAESVAFAATVAAAPVVAAAPTPAPTVMPSFAAPEPTATPVMPAAGSNAAYAQPNYQAPGKDRRPQTATTPGTPATRPSKPRPWLIPVAASVAALAVAGAAAAVVLPRLNANNSAATDTYDGPPQSGQSGQSDGGGASQASADQPAATFQDGAAVAWEARASDLMNDPRAVFAWPQVWDDYINELWLGPIDLGDEWLVLISTQDSGVLGVVAVDKLTGQKRWEIQSATLINCGVVAPGVVACLESDGPRARVSFRDSTSGSVTATHDLDYGAGSLAARDGFAAVTGSPGADGINTTIFDENGVVLGEAAVPLPVEYSANLPHFPEAETLPTP